MRTKVIIRIHAATNNDKNKEENETKTKHGHKQQKQQKQTAQTNNATKIGKRTESTINDKIEKVKNNKK